MPLMDEIRDTLTMTDEEAALSDMPGVRPGEERMPAPPEAKDAGLCFIGHAETPWETRSDAPRNAMGSDFVCTLHIRPAFRPALQSLAGTTHIIVLYWLHNARRDLLIQKPAHSDTVRGTFALRSPNRPNPIGLSVCDLLSIDQDNGLLTIRHIDCLNGTPILDIKPYFASVDSKPDAKVSWAK